MPEKGENMKRKLFTLGETILDIIFQNNEVKKARPGGSMLNTSVSLGRLGLPVYFISELADDLAGNLILNFLHSNNILCDYITIYKKESQTGISLAFLDEKNEASYNFYKKMPAAPERIIFNQNLDFTKNDILALSSFFAIDNNIHEQINKILQLAINKKCIVYYDINFRKSHLFQLDILKQNIEENISHATVLRGSVDDFYFVYNEKEPVKIYNLLFKKFNLKALIITNGPDTIHLFTSKFHKTYSVPHISVVSSIGAGDNFNAGVLYSVYKHNISLDDFDSVNEKIWDNIVNIGVIFSQEVCMGYDNYISNELAQKFKL